jgi:hypothetical protein
MAYPDGMIIFMSVATAKETYSDSETAVKAIGLHISAYKSTMGIYKL